MNIRAHFKHTPCRTCCHATSHDFDASILMNDVYSLSHACRHRRQPAATNATAITTPHAYVLRRFSISDITMTRKRLIIHISGGNYNMPLSISAPPLRHECHWHYRILYWANIIFFDLITY
jgi:hypothetical protein